MWCPVLVEFTNDLVDAWATAELEGMSDEQLIKEGAAVCRKAEEDESAALDYLRSIAGVARGRHTEYSYPEFIDMLVAAAAESPSMCRKAETAALEKGSLAK